jgi:undecaprenyl phosphate N,N'-diacetylbacillosamine 1-phosphate transferase
MSFVGPRPLPKAYFASMNDKQKLRYSVRPGITGLAQVNGRNKLLWNEKINFDLEYTRNINFLLDLSICIRSFKYLFSLTNNKELGNQSFDNFTPDFQ